MPMVAAAAARLPATNSSVVVRWKNMQSRRSFLAAPAAFALVDWPQWRGPNRDGAAPAEPGKPWPGRLRQVWNVQVGEGTPRRSFPASAYTNSPCSGQ